VDHSVVLRGIGSTSPFFAKNANTSGMPNQGPWRGKPAIRTNTAAKKNFRITLLPYEARKGSGRLRGVVSGNVAERFIYTSK
jgi:hypothetical protein